jgi:hypothetical protein
MYMIPVRYIGLVPTLHQYGLILMASVMTPFPNKVIF